MSSTHRRPWEALGFKWICGMGLWVWVALAVGVGLTGRGRAAEADPAGEQSKLFGLTNLWTIHLTISPLDWKLLNSEGGETPARPSELSGGILRGIFGGGGDVGASMQRMSRGSYTWATCTFECAGQRLTNVSIRFKGNSSFVRAPNAWKRPFRIDFNREAKGRRFMGEEEIVLNNNVNDATQMREALAYDLFRQAGVPAPRTAFARVYLTIPGKLKRQHLGLYTVIEPVEGTFLKRHFGNKAGVLVKPEMMPGIPYLGNNWRNYVGRYQPKGEVNAEAAKRLIELTRFIQEADGTEFSEGLKGYFDTEALLRFVALNAILANVDSFLGNGHNYYLFVDAATQKAHFIPWDVNEAFGMHPVSGSSGSQMKFSILEPNADPNTLVEKLVSDARLGRAYRSQCQWVLTNLFEPGRMHAAIDRVTAVTRPVVMEESQRAREDYERTVLKTMKPNQGDTSQPRWDRDLPNAPYRPRPFPPAVDVDNIPLKDWISGRHKNALGQLEGKIRGKNPRARLEF